MSTLTPPRTRATLSAQPTPTRASARIQARKTSAAAASDSEGGTTSSGQIRKRSSSRPRTPSKGSLATAKSPAKASSKQLKKKGRFDFEWPRKIFHSSIAIPAILLFVCGASQKLLQKITAVLLFVDLLTDVLRLSSRRISKKYTARFSFLMRDEEKASINGTVYYLLGALIVLSTVERDVAVVCILNLCFCDTLASVVGRRLGHHTPRMPSPPFGAKKSLAGTLAAVAAGSLVALAVWATPLAALGSNGAPSFPPPGATWETWAIMISLAGISAGLSEGIEIFGLDDNLTLPVLSAASLTISFKILKWFTK